jgi:hypothetical protein
MASNGPRQTFHVNICCLVLLSFALDAQAKICWIDHVESAAQGVRVYFMEIPRSMFINIMVAGQDAVYSLSGGGKLIQRNKTDKNITLGYLALKDGDKVFLNASPENGCSFTASASSTSTGLHASSWSGMAGPPSTAEAFIPAITNSH